ncbi:unnamed protein product [Mytilus coruscus]|uniref:Endonuclease/exonuclease/phosphatase domain-containing protein n=1 Tax=Mytilus coruscus TaxID=42192 RepID=A0A6J8DT74_MYTCO|nr:unnamed protein product [Mytilus coruscus]
MYWFRYTCLKLLPNESIALELPNNPYTCHGCEHMQDFLDCEQVVNRSSIDISNPDEDRSTPIITTNKITSKFGRCYAKLGQPETCDYRETVDELSEIVLKYKSSCDIIITGDMTVKDKPNTRDKMSLDFIQEHCLYTPNGLGDVNTYFHPSGKCATQIENIIESTPMLINYKALRCRPLNNSQNDLVAGCINLELDTYDSQLVISTLLPRVKWKM